MKTHAIMWVEILNNRDSPMDGDDVIGCAFCASIDLLVMDEEGKFSVLCTDCRATGPLEDTAEEAMESWSTRPIDDDIEALISRAKRIVLLS